MLTFILTQIIPQIASRNCRWEMGITYNTGIVLKVEVDAVWAAPGLALADNDSGHDLLTELGLSLLDGGHDHVTDTGSGETVQTGTDTLDGDDVEVTGTGVVAAVEDGTAVSHVSFPDFRIPFVVVSGMGG